MRASIVSWLGQRARLFPRRAYDLAATRRGSPAVEFALMAPLLITLMLGVNDISNALITQRQVTTAAQEAAEIATGLSANASTQQSVLTYDQAQAAASVIYSLMPGLSSGKRSSSFSVTLSSVQFTKSDPNCVPTANNSCYVGQVIWSVPLNEGPQAQLDQGERRTPCGKLNQVDPATLAAYAANPSNPPYQYLAALPTANVTAPTSLLIADVFYKFTPFLSFITGPIEFRRTSFLPPRVGNSGSDYVFYDPPNALTDTTDICVSVQNPSLPAGS